MLYYKAYDRARAYEYAKKWAFDRNPLFFDYTGIGGNCTNFVSQAIYAGGCVMNFTPIYGWYFLSDSRRTASWTGVEFFYDFIVTNTGAGPFGRVVPSESLEVGDVIQLGREGKGYYHTLLVTGFAENTYLVAAQSDNAFDRPLDTYNYDFARFVHIDAIRIELPDAGDCFEGVYDGVAIIPDAVSIPRDV